MKTPNFKKYVKGGFTLIELMVVIAILATLGSIAYGPIMDHMNDGDRQKASTNMKSIFTLLQQFKMDNGSFPCDATGERLQEENPDRDFGDLKGDYSNAYFRQLFFKNGVESEKPFFAKISTAGLQVLAEGDEKLAGGQALRRGENGMSYVMTRSKEDENVKTSVNRSNSPLVMCSVYPTKTPYSGDKLLVDMLSFKGHFFVLTADGAVTDHEKDIEESMDDETVGVVKAGKDIFPENKRGQATSSKHVVLTPEG